MISVHVVHERVCVCGLVHMWVSACLHASMHVYAYIYMHVFANSLLCGLKGKQSFDVC